MVCATAKGWGPSAIAIRLACVAVCVAVFAGPVLGDDFYWSAAANGAYADPNNWSPQGIPGANDQVLFELGASVPYTVGFEPNALTTNRVVTVGTDQTIFDLGGGTHMLGTFLGGAPGVGWDGNLWDGTAWAGTWPGQVGRLRLQNGTALYRSVSVGDSAGSTGQLDIAGATLKTDILGIGSSGTGLVRVIEGGRLEIHPVNQNWIWIANGDGGVGMLEVAGGGSIVTGGYDTSGQATLPEIHVGGHYYGDPNGYGRLFVRDGGTVESFEVTLAGEPSSSGEATITGPASSLRADGFISVASTGMGTLSVSDGALVSVFGGDPVLEIGAGGVVDVGDHATGGRFAVGGDADPGLLARGQVRLTTSGGGAISGALRGSGLVRGEVINAGGSVAPGLNGTGKLTVEGNYVQLADGYLWLEIAGAGAGDYDQLDVSGEVDLDGGVLRVEFINGFLPKAGDRFDLITFGMFSQSVLGIEISGVDDPNWQFEIDVLPDRYELVSLNDAVPEPTSMVLLAAGALAVGLRRRRSRA